MKGGRFGTESGEKRKQALTGLHENVISGLLREVESEFWPEAKFSEEAERLARSIPYFAINAFVEHHDDNLYISDGDMAEQDYNPDYPDGCDGVYSPDKAFVPNSASQLLELKAEIHEMWKTTYAMDTRHLRPYSMYCNRAVTALDTENSVVFGSDILDCFLGGLHRTLMTGVIPRIMSMKDGNLRAMMGIKASLDAMQGLGVDSEGIYNEAYDLISEYAPFDEESLEIISDFTSYESYASCVDIPLKSGREQAMSIYRCIAGIRYGKNPRLVKLKVLSGYFETIQPETAKAIERNVRLLPDLERDTILNSPHAPDFEKLTKDPNAEALAELNRKIEEFLGLMADGRNATEEAKREWEERLAELRAERDKKIEDLQKQLDDALAPSPDGRRGKR